MILLDANLLLYAVNVDAPDHAEARQWVEETFAGKRGVVGLTWPGLIAFVRIGTNPRALQNPFTLEEALGQIAEWIALPSVEIIGPGLDHARHFDAICRASNARANLITDAHLAAIAVEHDCDLASCDDDFAKFPGIRWINPLTR